MIRIESADRILQPYPRSTCRTYTYLPEATGVHVTKFSRPVGTTVVLLNKKEFIIFKVLNLIILIQRIEFLQKFLDRDQWSGLRRADSWFCVVNTQHFCIIIYVFLQPHPQAASHSYGNAYYYFWWSVSYVLNIPLGDWVVQLYTLRTGRITMKKP